MRRAVPLLLAVLAGPAFADTPPPGTDWKVLLVETVEAHGCVMTEEEAATMLPALGFEIDWTPSIVAELMDEGLVEMRESDFALVLKTENCK
ncbi:hypothetical protein [Pseudogemmobacter humi]|uniref:HMA domain-containing protein n=1 Tax=Pseudogemmobacter humi TaxID=2483812 RepID=A0A3P5XAQ6_9RHOB|nr:hypothetical protein [Pseudogemmobacter humi]VDC31709.1 hypothetical protein XINFAN_03081 [Pseudogemmobacter humi]